MLIVGVDEAGRGALAGPVVAAAIALVYPFDSTLVADSKQLSKTKREEAYRHLIETKQPIGLGIVNHIHIDRINILQATLLAMSRAILHLQEILPTASFHVKIDGNKAPKLPNYTLETIVQGDKTVPEISAASIIAKVTRDQLLEKLHRCFPEYGFCDHSGYGTPQHLDAIRQFGKSPVHRQSFSISQQLRLF